MQGAATRRLADLHPIHASGMNPITEAKLRKLPDDELLQAVTTPLDGQMIKARPGSTRVLDGNTRVHELQRRMNDPNSKIEPDLLIPVQEDF